MVAMMKNLSNQLLATALSRGAGIPAKQLEMGGTDTDLLHEVESRKDLKDIGLHALARICAAETPAPISFLASPTDVARRFMELLAFSPYIQASGGNLNLQVVLDESVNQSLSARFATFPSVIPFCARELENKDFRPHHSYEVTGGGFLQKIAESGELENLKVSDSKLSIEIDTQGAMLTIPRKVVINDGVGVIQQIGEIVGYKGAQTLERDFHRVLLDPANWTIDKNRLQGAGTAFGYSAMKASAEVWANQLDASGLPISASPSTLLVQAGGMGLDAKDLNQSEKVMTRSDNTVDRSEGNVFRGMLGNVVETQWLKHASMDTSTLKLKSALAWFQFADPAIVAAFGVCFLSGKKKPTIETQPAAFNSLGVQMRVFWDYGLGRIGSCGAIRNDGE